MITSIIIGSITGFGVFLIFGLFKGSSTNDYDKGYMQGWDNCEMSHLKKKTK